MTVIAFPLALIPRASRITVTAKHVRHRTLLGYTKRVPRVRISEILFVPRVDMDSWTTNGARIINSAGLLVLLDERNRVLLKLSSLNTWPMEELIRLRKTLGGANRTYRARVHALTLRGDYPQVMPYRHAHPSAFAFVAIVVFILAFAVFAVLMETWGVA